MKVFGDLEGAVMRVLWRRDSPMTVREVQSALARRRLAYTTMMTVMDRLWQKGLLDRSPRGRAYEYRPVMGESEYTAELIHELLQGTRDRRAALTHFVEAMDPEEEAELRSLAAQVRRRRNKGT